MKKTINFRTNKTIIHFILLLSISACGGGGESEEKKVPEKVITKTACEQYNIDSDEDCANVDGRAVITYAPADTSEYSGIAIFLHGAPGKPTKVANIFDAKMIANKFNLVSIAPEGNGSIYEWTSSNGDTSVSADTEFLIEVIDSIEGQYTFANRKVYIFGYSAGGFMAYKLACQIPDRLTAVISLAGQFRGDLASCSTSTPTAIHHLHSETDQDVSFYGRAQGNIASVNDTIELWRLKNGCSSEKQVLVQGGVTDSSTRTDTEIYTGCVKSLGLSKLDAVNHEDSYIADKLLTTYEYVLEN